MHKHVFVHIEVYIYLMWTNSFRSFFHADLVRNNLQAVVIPVVFGKQASEDPKVDSGYLAQPQCRRQHSAGRDLRVVPFRGRDGDNAPLKGSWQCEGDGIGSNEW